MTVSVCTHMLVIWIDTVMNRDFQGERGGKGGAKGNLGRRWSIRGEWS